MYYLVKSPWIIRKYYHECVWKFKTEDKKIYLTFDDGPNPDTTPFILEQLAKYNAKATFFCVGKQVEENPTLFEQIKIRGHSVGNHTYSHLNGWKTKNDIYFKDIQKAGELIGGNLFRPPYGRITRFQLRLLKGKNLNLKTIMWHILSGDFDTSTSPEHCYLNVVRHAGKGSIVVFHDSLKARQNMEFALPKTLEYFKEKGFSFEYI